MSVRKGCCVGGCLLKTIITLAIIVAIIGGAILWVINQTPASLGFADKDLGGKTVREMGFADVKIKDILSAIKSILRPDEAAIVDNPYDPVEDKASADTMAVSLGLETNEGGTPNYLALLGEESITTDEQEVYTYTDCEIAYMMDTMVTQAGAEADSDVQSIKDMNAEIRQVTITKGDTMVVEILLSINISSIKDNLPIPLLPDTLFLNSINTLSIDANGVITTTSQSIEINGMAETATDLIINAIATQAEQEGSENEGDPKQVINNAIGSVFGKVINNIGLVGTATVGESNEAVVGTIVYGSNGVQNHNITVITRRTEVI